MSEMACQVQHQLQAAQTTERDSSVESCKMGCVKEEELAVLTRLVQNFGFWLWVGWSVGRCIVVPWEMGVVGAASGCNRCRIYVKSASQGSRS